MNGGIKHKLTPAEEALFKRDPELGKAMEKLRDPLTWEEIEKSFLEAEWQLEEFGRAVDDLQRSLSMT